MNEVIRKMREIRAKELTKLFGREVVIGDASGEYYHPKIEINGISFIGQGNWSGGATYAYEPSMGLVRVGVGLSESVILNILQEGKEKECVDLYTKLMDRIRAVYDFIEEIEEGA